MWDEEINKKIIKDAADQYHPAYDDDAWVKMEQMLDEHLLAKKDRRRIIYFLPLILLLGAVMFFVISRRETTPSSKIPERRLQSIPEKPRDEHPNVSSEAVVARPDAARPGKNSVANIQEKNEFLKESSINAANSDSKKTDNLSVHGKVAMVNGNTNPTAKNLLNDQSKQKEDKSSAIGLNSEANSNKKNNANETINQPGKPSNGEIAAPAIADNNNPSEKINTNKANADVTKDEKETIKSTNIARVANPKDTRNNIKQKKTKKNFIQNIGIGLSIGPGISAVRLSKTGKITVASGAELSYSFTDRFTLRTGFYAAKKIYSANEDDYHVQPGNPGNYNYLESVNADCKVYEVPLTLSYNFGKVKNHNWFASAGLSSYFMKRESYVFFYKYPSGWTTSRSWTVTNQNKHYFSVLDVSAGYEYSFNKRFSIIAEPYLKVPLSGIGAGKIKLNSAGVLFTAGIKPF